MWRGLSIPARHPFKAAFPLREKRAHQRCRSIINGFFLFVWMATALVFAALGPQACTERPLPQASLGAEEAKIHKEVVGGHR